MRKLAALATAAALSAALFLSGCGAPPTEEEKQGDAEREPKAIVFEETVSPNEGYADSEGDVVHYTVRVSQAVQGKAVVSAESDSAFFEPVSYEVECGDNLSKSDVSVEWTTLMGNPESSEDDQIAIAVVAVRTADGSEDVRKISFVNGALETVAEAVSAAQ